jgi:asparagine synthase (glutamine-hydrolysing)
MCGIAGILYADTRRPVERSLLAAMAGAIAHRGPDAEGFWSEAGVGLAHRRLSIIDLAGGDQPIGNEDGSVQVVFNGEIYNYPELRRGLESRGHVFRTNSDTEVLVHLYEEEQEGLVTRLRGMFAFALWDGRRRKLLLARDRIGLKPLYVYRDHEKLVFGSELKAILACPGVDRTLDVEALEDYFCYGVIAGERSIFRRIRKLPPGHMLAVSGDDLNAAPQRYWEYRPVVDHSRSLDDWKEAIAAKVDETIEAHRLADVPIGAFLSGGVDSSVIVARLAAMSDRPIQTFSIGFGEEEFSELPYARETARRFGCEHIEEIITPSAAASLDDLVRFYDEPFADSSAIPTMHVARLASRHVKVVLSGDGGDEAFGGYSRYAHDLREAVWRERIPAWMRKGVLGPLARGWPKSDWLPRPLRAKTRLTNLSLSADEAYANTLSWCRPAGAAPSIGRRRGG